MPISVILVIPLGVLGAAVAASLRGLNNDVYFQVALLTTIGLSSKNAILIVEFAEAKVAEGYSLTRAALRAAQTRLRPIIMTSLAFIAGVTPLAVATGAGATAAWRLVPALSAGRWPRRCWRSSSSPYSLYW